MATTGSRCVALALVGVAGALGSCGGGGGGGGIGPIVLGVRFVGPGGTDIPAVAPDAVPRNAWVEITFSGPLDPASVVDPNLQIRKGPHFAAVSLGTFQVDGARVLFDPTRVPPAEDRPFGFDSSATYQILAPSGVPTGAMVRGSGGTPIRATHLSTFTTSTEWVRETVPPHLLSSRFEPPPLPDGRVLARSVLVLQFDESLDPTSVVACITSPVARARDGVEARFDAADPESQAAGLAGKAVYVRLTQGADARTLRVDPVFTWGDRPYRFHVNVLRGLRDLAQNALAESVALGPFTCEGDGATPAADLLAEDFDDSVDADPPETTARWGSSMPGWLVGAPITTRRVRVRGASVAAGGTYTIAAAYVVMAAPLTGQALNDYVLGVAPPTAEGRRVLLAFPASEIGPAGTITEAAWGPDRNATYAATHREVVLRFGYQATRSLDLSPGVDQNYRDVPWVGYRGAYTVAQRANVGNEVADTTNPTGFVRYDPLFLYSGFASYPALSAPFEWVPGDSPTAADEVLLFDVSAVEAETWQDSRTIQYVPFLANAFGPLPPILPAPNRSLVTIFEGNYANPAATAGGPGVPAVPNPMPLLFDTAFTLVDRRTVATSRFYSPEAGDPTDGSPTSPRSRVPTLGALSDYGPVTVVPPLPATGPQVVVEYQGATAVDPASDRRLPGALALVTPWTADLDDCDGYPYLRWRAVLVGDVATQEVPRVDAVIVPVRRKAGP